MTKQETMAVGAGGARESGAWTADFLQGAAVACATLAISFAFYRWPLQLLAGAGTLLIGTVLLRRFGLCSEPRPMLARATRAEPTRE